MNRDRGVTAIREMVLAGEEFRMAIAKYFGVGVRDAAALSYLASRGDMTQSDLVHAMGLTSAAVTALVDRLETAGLVHRTAHPTDRRRTVLQLTERASELLMRSFAGMSAALDHVVDREQAADVLTLVAAGLREQVDVLHQLSTGAEGGAASTVAGPGRTESGHAR